MNLYLRPRFFVLTVFLFPVMSFGQVYEVIDFECLDVPFVMTNANHDNTILHCTDGQLRIDTMEQDCYEFYEEDGNIFRGWYYNAVDNEGTTIFAFDQITLHNDDQWNASDGKYFELQRAGFWLTLPSLEDDDRQFSLALKDLSDGGINIGFSMENGALYFPTLADVLDADFPGLTLNYANEILTVEGQVRNVFVGGDHLYFGQLRLSELITSTAQVEAVEVHLFPNPTTVELNIRSKKLTNAIIQLYTATGVRCTTQISTGENTQLNVGHLPAGTYWVQIWKNEQLIHTEAIVKL